MEYALSIEFSHFLTKSVIGWYQEFMLVLKVLKLDINIPDLYCCCIIMYVLYSWRLF